MIMGMSLGAFFLFILGFCINIVGVIFLIIFMQFFVGFMIKTIDYGWSVIHPQSYEKYKKKKDKEN